MIYNCSHILQDIKNSVENKIPFSIVRLGDGDIKLLVSALKGDTNNPKFRQQGIPPGTANEILDIYKHSCNTANYISSFDIYFSDDFWYRNLSPGTRNRMAKWKGIYQNVGIENESYCNPEVGFFFFLNQDFSLFNILKGKEICLITCYPVVEKRLKKIGISSRVLQIPGRYSNHYSRFQQIKRDLKKQIDSVDIFLIGAGALGRGYSYAIKRKGGIAIDIGQVFDAWTFFSLPDRLKGILTINKTNLNFSFTNKYKKFESMV